MNMKMLALKVLYVFSALLVAGAVVFLPFVSEAEASLLIVTRSATGVSDSGATLQGLVFPADATEIRAWFEWGDSTQLNNTTSQQILTGTGGGISAELSALREDTTYYYRIVAKIGTGGEEVSGSVFTFTTDATNSGGSFTNKRAPFAITTGVILVTNNSAVLNGFSDTAENATFWFEWGESSSLNKVTGAQNVDKAFYTISREITNLKEGHKYYFRAVAKNNEGTSYGATLTFFTDGKAVGTGDNGNGGGNNGTPGVPTSPTRPHMQTRSVTAVTQTSAVLKGRAENLLGDDTTVWFQWGTGPGFGNVTLPQKFSVIAFDFASPIGGLKPKMKYYYRAVGGNDSGIAFGETLTFTTGDGTVATAKEMNVFTGNAKNITVNSAALNAFAALGSMSATGWIEWGPTKALGNKTAVVALNNTGAVNFFNGTASGLAANTTYYYQAAARDANGEKRGIVMNFHTPGAGSLPSPAGSVSARTRIFQTVKNLSFPNGTDIAVAVRKGNTIEYSVAVRNVGGSTLTNAKVFGKLSPFVHFESASDNGEFNKESRVLSWQMDTLAAGSSRTLTVRVTAGEFEKNVVAEQTFRVTAGAATDRTSNKTIAIINLSPLILEVSADPEDASPGERIRYTVRYANEGEAALRDAALRIVLPSGMRFVESGTEGLKVEDNVLMASIGEIKAGESGTLAFTGEIKSTVSRGEELTVVAVMSFTDAFLKKQVDVTNYAPIVVGGGFFGGAASVFGVSFLPSTLVGWLLLILLIILVIIAGAKLYELARGKKEELPNIKL